MKIWHITKALHGGSGQYVLRLHEALRARGVDSNLLLLEGKEQPAIFKLERTAGVVDRMATRTIRGVTRRVVNAPFHSLLGRERYRSPVAIASGDCIHLHGLTGRMGLVGLADLIPQGARVFWTLHDVWPLTGGCVVYSGCHGFVEDCGCCPVLRRGLAPWARLELRLKERLVRTRDIQPVANSSWTAGRIAESRVFRGKEYIPIIPPIVDDSFVPGSPRAVREELGINAGAKVICVGARAVTDPFKGIPQFLNALGKLRRGLPPLDVLLFGEGRLDPIEGVRIHFLGKVEDSRRMADVYRASDLYVSPSLMETFGMAVAEAQACGTTVAGYRVGGLVDAVWEGDAHNFVQVEEKALLTVVERILATTPEKGVRSAARAAWVARRFSAAAVAEEQEKVYETAFNKT